MPNCLRILQALKHYLYLTHWYMYFPYLLATVFMSYLRARKMLDGILE
ncbi:hypothetical protein X970_01630 [Pseudomonas monteilii SB3101]|uniref:Uncharacterized protein n=1 Tax=Pseudomonas monteilii SB3101 TaxID=1435058 RepID=V9VAU8_9PSED|nr:hypothetical protein X969_01640 [Pseudomonas monteilii SB3078]AHC91020.1 hypothetical protein X970_01630 [Pseudomonas monteilii SB3101]